MEFYKLDFGDDYIITSKANALKWWFLYGNHDDYNDPETWFEDSIRFGTITKISESEV